MHTGVKATRMKAEARRTWPSSESASEWRGPGNSLAPFLEISLVKLVDNLPKPSLISKPRKIAYMISISCVELCGEEDFRRRSWRNARLRAGTAGVFQAKKYRYGLDKGAFWSRDKCRIIAVLCYQPTGEGVPIHRPIDQGSNQKGGRSFLSLLRCGMCVWPALFRKLF